MWEFDSEVSEVIQRTPDIKSFRFPTRAGDLSYLPGQFFIVTIKVKGEDASHYFSFSSSPTDKGYVEFTKRITASNFSQALDKMKPGDQARLQGPLGRFTLPDEPARLTFLSGGIGITPLRSMMRYVTAMKLRYNIVLLYGNKSFDDIAFRDEVDEMAASNPDIRVEYVLSGPNLPAGWKGKTGVINKDLVREVIPDFAERQFYISGPPKMVVALEEQIASLPVPGGRIKRDSFTGYD
ncbi:MAG: FAD-binding oxidoreductase [Dehalococcoidales bacterium]|nr:FAD-binding oxidoreductase [Dehalococcoidales bacterium]